MRRFFVPACLERRKGGGKSIPRSVKLIVSHILTYSNNKLAVSLLQKINISCKLISKHDNGTVRDGQSGDRHAHPACTPGRGAHAGKAGGEDRCIHGVCKPIESGSRAPGLETLVKLADAARKPDLLVLGGAPGGDAEACLAALVQGRARPASVCWRSAWCEACLQRWTVWMQSRRNADACVFRKRRESAARGAVKRCVERISGRKRPCARPGGHTKNSPGNKMLFRRAVFFIQYYFRGKRAAFCHRFCRSVCSSRRATSVSPGTMAQASRSISGVGGSMSGTITVKHPAAAPARTPL